MPLINKATRITVNSPTLIDNVFCADIINESVFNGILYTDIDYYFPIHSIKLI